jgi:hypothetical protein
MLKVCADTPNIRNWEVQLKRLWNLKMVARRVGDILHFMSKFYIKVFCN